jgi:hypothetical protein
MDSIQHDYCKISYSKTFRETKIIVPDRQILVSVSEKRPYDLVHQN